MRRKLSKLAVLLSALGCSSAALAAEQATDLLSPAENAQSASVYTLDAAGPTSLTPVMYWLSGDSVGKWMTDNHLSIQGFVEGGYFYDANNPRLGTNARGDSPTLVVFPGAYSNRGLLDQADITFQKTIDSTKSWDWGFQIEGGYGIDDAQIHSNGILDNRAGLHPDNQMDLIQANVSLLVPLGSGLTIKAGKFVALFGEEYINSTLNAFYSHTYSFFYAIPGTNTGVLGSYTFAKLINGQDQTLTAGITRGWNQSSRDTNGAIDFEGELSGKLTDKFSYTLNFSEGPEAPNAVGPSAKGLKGDNSDYWTAVEFIPSYAVSDQLTASADLVYGDFPHGSATAAGHAAQWFSVAPYLSYKWNSNFTFNFRGEWYRDQGGFSVPANGGPISANYYAVTVGTTIHPFPSSDVLQWLELRPEVRYDLSDRPVFNHAHSSALSGSGDYNQLTAAMDVIMQF
jgi:hypothetical protein